MLTERTRPFKVQSLKWQYSVDLDIPIPSSNEGNSDSPVGFDNNSYVSRII